jgi:hypothetical protein
LLPEKVIKHSPRDYQNPPIVTTQMMWEKGPAIDNLKGPEDDYKGFWMVFLTGQTIYCEYFSDCLAH